MELIRIGDRIINMDFVSEIQIRTGEFMPGTVLLLFAGTQHQSLVLEPPEAQPFLAALKSGHIGKYYDATSQDAEEKQTDV
jgi:hypothetical protein